MTVEEPERGDGSASDREVLARKFGLAHDDELFEQALTHPSYANENGVPSDQRLVFVGQPALWMGVTDILFRRRPEDPEGSLSKLRSAAVATPLLAEVARSLDIDDHIRLGHGEQTSGGANKDPILADALMALIGVVHLQFGVDRTFALVHELFDESIEELAALDAGRNWKQELKDLAADKGLEEPWYRVDKTGSDHKPDFKAWVQVGGFTYGPSEVRKSKKEAEKEAAEAAWYAISDQTDD
ncbi:ribonuclease III family protein [Spirillospora sp. CA-128828]|uniref:ribonuclease III family protein n=1 Tax=Spirillospora sp. CA-128828 TaxID=3240033 RepID=UPI003D8CFF26